MLKKLNLKVSIFKSWDEHNYSLGIKYTTKGIYVCMLETKEITMSKIIQIYKNIRYFKSVNHWFRNVMLGRNDW